ncbi:hypothetical protein MMC16_003415 [Acarospora aff. strigata]|nr:hypothetical protein [Acarospora aff. strigata]
MEENTEVGRKEQRHDGGDGERLRNSINAQMLVQEERAKPVRRINLKLPERTAISGKDRISSIVEESATGLSPAREPPFPSAIPTGSQTTSTESNRTVRGSALPTPAAQYPARTPSYPFPTMSMGTPTIPSTPAFHKPFTALSPTIAPPQMRFGLTESFRDREASSHGTPSSATTFLPQAASVSKDDLQYPNPNLYELALRLSSDPGLEPWWSNVVSIMKEDFNASRVTLAVPSDSTDVENIPWAQIATYNAGEDDDYSLTNNDPQSTQSSLNDSSTQGEPSLGPGSSTHDAAVKQNSNLLGFQKAPGRPKLESRHSFAGFGQSAGDDMTEVNQRAGIASRRPGSTRTNSSISLHPQEFSSPGPSDFASLSLDGLGQQGLTDGSQSSSNLDFSNLPNAVPRGRVFPVLQPLEYESDPLISSAGAVRVLDRAKITVLTREYFNQSQFAQSRSSKAERRSPGDKDHWGVALASSREATPISSSKGHITERPSRPLFLHTSKSSRESRRPKSHTGEASKPFVRMWNAKDISHANLMQSAAYEDYEQIPASPWSQSPAPSPAIRGDEEENPFFKNAGVDEDAFTDNPPPHDYSAQEQIEAIGIDKGCTVVHIPLIHPVLSKSVRPSRLSQDDSQTGKPKVAGGELPSFAAGRTLEGSIPSTENDPKTPIAIMSILSSTLPYPPNLVSSIKLLAPHLATSFHQSRQYTTVLKEAVAFSGWRYGQTNSFGLEGTLNRAQHLKDNAALAGLSYLAETDNASTVSVNASLTSPSEYSSMSIYSPRDSISGMASWEGPALERPNERVPSGGTPGHYVVAATDDGYFHTRAIHSLSRAGSGAIPTLASLNVKRSNSPTNPSPREAQFNFILNRSNKWETSSNTAPNTPGEDPGDSHRSALDYATKSRGGGATSRKQGIYLRLQRASTDASLSTSTAQREHSPLSLSNEQEVIAGKQPSVQIPTRNQRRHDRPHTQIHSHGANFSATFQALPAPSASRNRPLSHGPKHARTASDTINAEEFAIRLPSTNLLRTIVDMLPAQMFIAEPYSGAIAWVNSRFLTYRNEPEEASLKRPWHIVHRDDRGEFLGSWSQALRTGEQLSQQVRLRRFDHQYRWFHIAIVPIKDAQGIVRHWLGTAMDIHDQHVAEVDAAREKEKAASEAKYRSLANASPQIIFAATVTHGITFANSQWLSYSGQRQEQAQRLGFLDCVHPADVLNCRLPISKDSPLPNSDGSMPSDHHPLLRKSSSPATDSSETSTTTVKTARTAKDMQAKSRLGSGDFLNTHSMESKLARLARDGIIKTTRDADGHLALSTEVRLRSKDNEYRWHLVRITLTDFVNDHDEAEWYGTCTDINDQKQVEQMLKETMEAKTRFLSNMSHEIRTPLNGIYAAIPFLIGNNLNEDQKDMVDTIRNSAEGLTSLINHILDLSKVEAGMVELKYDWFHVRSMVEDVNDVTALKANEKCLELSYMADENVPSMVKGDMNRIRQVLINIVGNAIKFTAHGEVYVHCKVLHNDQVTLRENEILLCFEVMDTGSGFNEEEAKLLFKPFSQIDGSTTRQHGGTGLGLAISKQLVELHGGRISASSVPGNGSTFSFFAKFQVPSANDHPPTPKPSRVSSRVRLVSASGSAPSKESVNDLKTLILDKGWTQSPSPAISSSDASIDSPAMLSSGSSDPSIRSIHTYRSDRSSASSIIPALSPAKELEASHMNIALPSNLPADIVRSSVSQPKPQSLSSMYPDSFHPPMYSILIVCRQEHSRSATVQHIEQIIPQSTPHQITAVGDVAGCQNLIAGDEPFTFTHVILNLRGAREIIQFMDQIFISPLHKRTCLVIVTDHSQKNEITELASGYDYAQLEKYRRIRFIFKPVKPAKFAVIFDPNKERDLSTDRNKETALLAAVSERQIFDQVKEALGNRGLKVLAVEDNLINLRMLIHFFKKASIDVETAGDGVQCTNKVFSHDPGYYSVIVCDIQMPNKDGYQTTREIREWERANKHPPIPIIALSANVMSEGLEKSMEAGFNEYVTKPVNWKILGRMLINLIDPNPRKASKSRGSNST